MSPSIIEFEKVVAGYSPSLTILNETTLDARRGEITLLIGPNGAGKSTVLKTLFGLLLPRLGEIRFEGQRINGKPPRELLAEGIAFVPQGRNLFGSLSVRHNLELGGITLPRAELRGRIDEVLQRFPRINERIDRTCAPRSDTRTVRWSSRWGAWRSTGQHPKSCRIPTSTGFSWADMPEPPPRDDDG